MEVESVTSATVLVGDDEGDMLHARDKKRAIQLYRTKSLGKSPSLDATDLNHFEPDWSSFESSFAKDLLPTKGSGPLTSSFLLEVVDILLDYVKRMNDRSTKVKVLDFHHPHQLRDMMNHCLDLSNEPQTLEQVLSDCKETLKYCVRTGHPRFFNQLSTGLDIIALAGEWLTATANTNMFTYEIAPVFTLMEEIVLNKMREYVGWEPQKGDGIFSPGGAISNLYAVIAARHSAMPQAKTNGLFQAQRLVVLTSEHSHFSILRAAAILGIGTENVIHVKTDSRGKMCVTDLENMIEKVKSEGSIPFIVCATVGTTVLGAFDPINDIADVCEKYGIWLHVDGAWGGSALLSKKYCHLVAGIHRANSVTWNPHKLMGVILQCSAILIRQNGILEDCNSMHATYLYQQDKHYDLTYDTGDKSLQCGRHNDIFKLWLMWRAKGDTGFEEQLDKLLDLSTYLQKKLRTTEGFEFVLDPAEFINVCFWYVPKRLRQMPRGTERDALLNKVAPQIKSKMMEKGTLMVGYQPLGLLPNFFRAIVSNPGVETGDIDFLVSEIRRLGEETV